MNICVYGASSNRIDKTYLDAAEHLGYLMAQHGHTLVFGAGDSGVMGAAARGMRKFAKNAVIYGVVPEFFNVDGVLFDDCTRLIYCETMRERKTILQRMSEAFVIAPGGIGTYDEFYEILTLKQLCRHKCPIVLLNIDGFYDSMLKFLQDAEDKDFIKTGVKKLYKVCNTPEDVLEYLENYTPQDLNPDDLKIFAHVKH